MSCSIHRYEKNTPEKEFRGFWVATVVNIDWPKNKLDSGEKQKRDFIAILDFYKKLNFNAAIVQIRTAGDAFYPTNKAPWSKYLSGKEGLAPIEFDDPLVWMIEETHKRNMEFHAWLNPYRATFDLDTLALANSHDFYQHPNWMVKYGKKYYYNPGLPAVQDKFSNIVKEVVANYEIDAIHFDDYFYPYKIKGQVFNDSVTYQSYGLPNQELGDWRRSNVDSLVRKVHKTIKETKSWVQFGISPFGVWKNKTTDVNGSDTQAGQTTYEDLYADPLLWMEKGWLDYLVPQAYWSMDYPRASYRKIALWWANIMQRTNLYMGNGPYKIKNNPDRAWDKKNEIPNQVLLARDVDNISGNVFFSAKSLMNKHHKVVRKLRKIYMRPSQNPTPKSKMERTLTIPKINSLETQKNKLEFCVEHKDNVPRFVLYFQLNDSKNQKAKNLIGKSYLSESQVSDCTYLQLTKKQTERPIGIVIVDAYGNESRLLTLHLNKEQANYD